jgi:tetratricopeptide (TPR) repeat protein
LELATDLVNGPARSELERELLKQREAAGAENEADHGAQVDEGGTSATRAERWTEIAERRENRGDAPGAVRALLEACKLEPGSLGRWSALERVAAIASDDDTRILALQEIAKRVGSDGRAAVYKRLARAHGNRHHLPEAERVWREVLALDPADEEADQGIESVIVAEGRYSDLAAHLDARAKRLSADPARGESVRAVRLRRAAILEQRLGRIEDACDELTRLLADTPDNPGALRYLADLLERCDQPARAEPLWSRAAALEPNLHERELIEVRAGRAAAGAGNFSAALEHARHVLSYSPTSRTALELRCDAARAVGADAELASSLDDLASLGHLSAESQSRILVEAALASARSGDRDRALDLAQRAASTDPRHATAQLLARGLEYRMRGPGTPEDARATLEALSQVDQPVGADDAALRSFLVAEARDVLGGGAAGMSELEAARAALGVHPLIAVGLAERFASQGNLDAAVDAYHASFTGPLLGLRAPGTTALSAADAALQAKRPDDAAHFLDLAERHGEASAEIEVRRRKVEEQNAARPRPSEARGAEGRIAAPERALREALADGRVDAGDTLVEVLAKAPDRNHDIVQVRYALVGLEPGDRDRLQALRSAALADGDPVHARAVEHVLHAFESDGLPVPPPPLTAQSQQPGILSLLTRPSVHAAAEALALLWEGAPQLFAREAASYSITGVERVVPGQASLIARLYDVAVRVLDAPRIPLFVPRSASSAASSQVALLHPASVILSGDLREASTEVLFELGRGMSGALPQNVLCLGLPNVEGRRLVEALRTAFGPPESTRSVNSPAAKMAEALWQLLPPRTQRRMQQLLGGGAFPEYENLVARARQSGRRVGMFLSGDFAHAARTLLSECAESCEAPTPENLGTLCRRIPELADLLCLAVSREYACARWRDAGPPASRTASGRFSLA